MAHHGRRAQVYQRELSVFYCGGGYFILNGGWDLVIAHPPCTDLAASGARWFKEKQIDFRQQKACVFFMQMVLCRSDHVAVENPVGIMSTCYRKPDQIIQPYQFGHGEVKSTCLWLNGLPKLEPTNIVDGREQRIWKLPPSVDRAKIRSKTYTGIAKAMAEQWSEYIEGENNARETLFATDEGASAAGEGAEDATADPGMV